MKVYKITKRDNQYTYKYRSELPISGGKVDTTGEELDKYHSGVTIDIVDPGEYFIEFNLADSAAIAGENVYIKVEGDSTLDETVSVTSEPISVVAKPTSSKVLVNGEDTSFDAYTINGNNYFKLRDLAMVVSGTNKQFEVAWDGTKNAINLISNKQYITEADKILATGDGEEKKATLSTSKIYKDGQEVTLTAYTINGNNYFKLRDIAKAFNIGITWDASISTVCIDTSIGYETE